MAEKRYLKPERVAAAVTNLADWRNRARGQGAMHLWPLLSLVHGGVGKSKLTNFAWGEEKKFWDDFFRFPDTSRRSTSNR